VVLVVLVAACVWAFVGGWEGRSVSGRVRRRLAGETRRRVAWLLLVCEKRNHRAGGGSGGELGKDAMDVVLCACACGACVV